MRVSRKLILAAGVVVAAGSSAVAVAATQSGSSSPSSTSGGPAPYAARAHDRGPGGPGRMHGPRLDANARSVAPPIRKAVLARVVTVAGPLVDQAVSAGDLSQAQADTAKQALADVQ